VLEVYVQRDQWVLSLCATMTSAAFAVYLSISVGTQWVWAWAFWRFCIETSSMTLPAADCRVVDVGCRMPLLLLDDPSEQSPTPRHGTVCTH
jgi:hypothetical protein